METPGGENRLKESSTDRLTQYTERRHEDDMISLIDLVAVLVRYRTMIVVAAILAGVLTVVGLYVGPLVGFDFGPQPQYTAQRQIFVENIPQGISEYINIDPVIRLQSILNDPAFVGEVYAQFEENAPTDRTPERFLAMVQRDILGKAYEVEWESGTRILTLRYTASTPEEARTFVEAVTSQGTSVLRDQINSQLESTKSVLNRIIAQNEAQLARLIGQAIDGTSTTSFEILVDEIIAYLEFSGSDTLSTLASVTGDINVLEEVIEEPHRLASSFAPTAVFEVLEERSLSPASIGIVAAVLVFFAMVFLAFVLEYVRRVKRDAQEMHKLQSAWRRKD